MHKKHNKKTLLNHLIHPKSYFPEIKSLKSNSETLTTKPYKEVKRQISKFKKENDVYKIPDLTKDLYFKSLETKDRKVYEIPYKKRRELLSVLSFETFIERENYTEQIEALLKEICNEYSWVVPAHDGRHIDIYATDTASILAEVLGLIGEKVDRDVYKYVVKTIDSKILTPFVTKIEEHKWYKKPDNWNAVCNSQIGLTSLILVDDISRKSQILELVLDSLNVYISDSFANDGTTSEGVKYWNYGISMFTIFAEALFNATSGSINLFDDEKVKKICNFPLNMRITAGNYASFSDSQDFGIGFNPGIIQKLSERTHNSRINALIEENPKPNWMGISTLLRYTLWWDGSRSKNIALDDLYLPDAQIIKLHSENSLGSKQVLVAKAGNNNENHNHNDVGSFILNFNGENVLTDPGAGAYTIGYHTNETRYENIFANSFGHSVPVIDGRLQAFGEKFRGEILGHSIGEEDKFVEMDISSTYDLPSLKRLTRKLSFSKDGNFNLTDKYSFDSGNHIIEEVFVTYNDVEVVDGQVEIQLSSGKKLKITSESDLETDVRNERLEKESRENNKERVLNRIVYKIKLEKRDGLTFGITIGEI